MTCFPGKIVSEQTAKRLYELVDEICAIIDRGGLKHTHDAMHAVHLALANDIPFEDAPYDDAFFPFEIEEKIAAKLAPHKRPTAPPSDSNVIHLSDARASTSCRRGSHGNSDQ